MAERRRRRDPTRRAAAAAGGGARWRGGPHAGCSCVAVSPAAGRAGGRGATVNPLGLIRSFPLFPAIPPHPAIHLTAGVCTHAQGSRAKELDAAARHRAAEAEAAAAEAEAAAAEAEAAAAEALLAEALDAVARSGALPLDRLPQVQQARAEAAEARQAAAVAWAEAKRAQASEAEARAEAKEARAREARAQAEAQELRAALAEAGQAREQVAGRLRQRLAQSEERAHEVGRGSPLQICACRWLALELVCVASQRSMCLCVSLSSLPFSFPFLSEVLKWDWTAWFAQGLANPPQSQPLVHGHPQLEQRLEASEAKARSEEEEARAR
jgi:hypothetical protein